MIHVAEFKPVRLFPTVPELGDVLDLAALEEARWPEMLESLEGPVATSFVSEKMIAVMTEPFHSGALEAKWAIGNPGPAGTENPAAETATRSFTLSAAETRGVQSAAAATWSEVKHKEEYKFAVWETLFSAFYAYAELVAPVPVEIGDTVVVPAGGFKLTM